MYNYIKLPQALQQVRQHRFVTLKWVPADNEKVHKVHTKKVLPEIYSKEDWKGLASVTYIYLSPNIAVLRGTKTQTCTHTFCWQ